MFMTKDEVIAESNRLSAERRQVHAAKYQDSVPWHVKLDSRRQRRGRKNGSCSAAIADLSTDLPACAFPVAEDADDVLEEKR